MVIGEATGVTEAAQGLPFVGESGHLIRQELHAAGINPSFDVYFTNAVLCRPRPGVKLTREAIVACNARLRDEIEMVRPKKILAVGAAGLTAVLGATKTAFISKERGRARWLDYDGSRAVLMPTWHPAAVMRSPELIRDLRRDIGRLARIEKPEDEPEVEVVVARSEAEILWELDGLRTASCISCDLETEGLDPTLSTPITELHDGRVVTSIGFGALKLDGSGFALIIPWFLFTDAVLCAVADLIENEDGPIIDFWNAAFDLKMLDTFFARPLHPTRFRDGMIESYAIDERPAGAQAGRARGPGVHSLKVRARVHYDDPGYALDMKKWLQTPEADRDYNALHQYQALDCHFTRRLADDLLVEMRNGDVDTELLEGLLYPAVLALKEIEARGTLLDTDTLNELRGELEQKQEQIRDTVREVAGKADLNMNSARQLSALLYGPLGLRRPMRKHHTSTDTDEAALLVLLRGASARQRSVVQGILDYRQTATALRTFVVRLLRLVSQDGRIRTTFLLHGTITGRLSSQPNLQNLPRPDEEDANSIGHLIRRCFVASPGMVLLNADFAQLELRVAAALSGDAVLTQAFLDGGDIHKQVAAIVFRVPYDAVTKAQRYVAKRINFGVIYGQTAAGLVSGQDMARLGSWSLRQAEEFVAEHRKSFPGLARWCDETTRHAISYGVVTTPFGRRRRFAYIPERLKGEVERQSVNAPIQATASDICLDALIRLHNRLDPEQARILLTVHDSILLEVRTELLKQTTTMVREIMEAVPLETEVPFVIDVESGPNWADVKPLT